MVLIEVLLSYCFTHGDRKFAFFDCAQCFDLGSFLIALGLPHFSGMAFFEALMNSLEAKTLEEWLRPCWPWCSTTRSVTDSTGEKILTE